MTLRNHDLIAPRQRKGAGFPSRRPVAEYRDLRHFPASIECAGRIAAR